jgi:hypothetical protein
MGADHAPGEAAERRSNVFRHVTCVPFTHFGSG